MPKSVAPIYALDENNGNSLWADSISKETKNVNPAFRKLHNGKLVPIGYHRVNCHMIFGVKMEYFRRKDRLVEERHAIEQPATITYAIVVSRETVIIALTLDALNNFLVKVMDIQNAYITAPVTENI